VRILLVRLRLIGDVVFTTPAVQAIRRRFPDAHLAYLVEPAAAPVVSSNPSLDEVIVAGRPGRFGRVSEDARLALRIRQGRFDVAIDFHGGPRARLLTLASGAPSRIGYDLAGTGRSRVYTRLAHRSRELRARHSVENQWDLLPLLDPAFETGPDPRRDPVVMIEDETAAAHATAVLQAAGVRDEHFLIVAHVSAGNPFRRWPAESFADAIAAIAQRDARRRILLTSGPSDAEARDRVRETVRSRLGTRGDAALVRCPELGLAELRAVLARAALFIGGDSGPLHIAATTRTPIVGIYGPTLAARSAPWRDPELVSEEADAGTLPCRPCAQRTCEPGDFRCLTGLAGRTVAEAAERALARAAEKRFEPAPAPLRERLA
jgi:ADP-heptose:LPS heptosyltransferase